MMSILSEMMMPPILGEMILIMMPILGLRGLPRAAEVRVLPAQAGAGWKKGSFHRGITIAFDSSWAN